MKPHTLKIDDFIKWVDTQRILYAFFDGEDKKRLYCTLNGGFEIDHNGTTVWRGTSPKGAIKEYNSI